MKALVTGATGFIGSSLAEALVRRGDDVTCLVRATSDRSRLEPLGVRFLFGDIGQPETITDAVGGFDAVYHLAGLTKAARPEHFFRANAEGAVNLVQALSRVHGAGRLIYVSSLAAAGPSLDGEAVREETPEHPVSAYGASKLAGEKAVRAAGDRVDFTIVRPSAVYGPRDRDFLVIFRAIQRHVFPFWGVSHYSLIYVDDLVRGIIRAAEHPAAAGETFFLASPEIVTNEEIADAIASALGRRPLRVPIPSGLMSLIGAVAQKIDKKGIMNTDRIKDFQYRRWTCDAGKAARTLGFRPEVSLREGISWTADWYRKNRWL
ncbi:MAG: NAD(P)-dependent oxidoreductase [Thermodesulfovibrionales bacterium]